MSLRSMNFTKEKLIAAEPKVGEQYVLRDQKVQGLILIVSPKGTKSFYLYKKINGKPKRLKIGSFPHMGIPEARKRASKLILEISAGEDPAKDKKRKKSRQLTFGELFAIYMEQHSKVHKKTWAQDQGNFSKHLRGLEKKPVDEIQKSYIQSIFNEISIKSGKTTANRVLALVSSVFERARFLVDWEGVNPTLGIKKNKEMSRRRFLRPDEVTRFFNALEQIGESEITDIIKLLLFTGARLSNVLSMRWDAIDFDLNAWDMTDVKNDDAPLHPLTSNAVEILRRRHVERLESPFVFPGTGKTGHIVEIKRGWRRVLALAEIADFKIHDLRRTFGSWQTMAGVPIALLGKSMGHKSLTALGIYSRSDIEPVREAMELGNSAMMKQVKKNCGK